MYERPAVEARLDLSAHLGAPLPSTIVVQPVWRSAKPTKPKEA